MNPPTHTLPTTGDMIAFGVQLAADLAPGDVLSLNGPLGAGKTHLVKGIARGLGYDGNVTSPTFSLVNEYRAGRLPLFHFDFYRLDSAEALIRIGWDDYLDEDGIIVVEWGAKYPELLPETTREITIQPLESGERTLTIS